MYVICAVLLHNVDKYYITIRNLLSKMLFSSDFVQITDFIQNFNFCSNFAQVIMGVKYADRQKSTDFQMLLGYSSVMTFTHSVTIH